MPPKDHDQPAQEQPGHDRFSGLPQSEIDKIAAAQAASAEEHPPVEPVADRSGDTDPSLDQEFNRLQAEAVRLGLGGYNAVRCEIPSAGYFPQGDPRAGAYKPGQVYRVGHEITAEQAAALLAGGGFTAVSTEE